MTEDTSPENLRKFLESDDPALRVMGLSMFEGLESHKGDESMGTIIGLYMFDNDKNVRSKAKSIFTKHSSDELIGRVKECWKASDRNIKSDERTVVIMEKIINKLKDTDIRLRDFCIEALDSGRLYSMVNRAYCVGTLKNLNLLEEDRLDLLLSNLDGSSAATARDELQKIGTPAVIPLIKALGDEAPSPVTGRPWQHIRVRDHAASALGEIGDERAVEPLIKALGDEGEYVRQAAAEALGKIGDERAVEPLIKALEDESAYVRRYVAPALDKLGGVPENDGQRAAYLIAVDDWESLAEVGDPAVEPLIKVLRDDNWSVRLNAAKALGKIGNERAVEPLIKALEDEDGNVRSPAAKALGRIDDKRAVDPLIKVLRDDSGWVRGNAAWALGEIGNSRAVEPLIESLGGEDRSKYASASAMLAATNTANALVKITEANIKGKEKKNIIKFLESDDPGMARMGASMLKGILKE